MLNDTFAKRLQKALDKNNMKPSELSAKTGLDKSLISNYLSGNYKAKQDKLTILAEALNTNEVWLMGYDVSSNPNYQDTVIHNDEKNKSIFYFSKSKKDNIIEQYKILFDKDDKLTENQKEFIMNTIIEQHRKFDEEHQKKNSE